MDNIGRFGVKLLASSLTLVRRLGASIGALALPGRISFMVSICLVSVSLLSPRGSHGETATTTSTPQALTPQQADSLIPNAASGFRKNPEQRWTRNWHFLTTVGFSNPTYDDALKTRIDEMSKKYRASSPQAGTFELPGFYYQVQERLMLGILGHFMFEHFVDDWRKHESLAIHYYNPALSTLYFLGLGGEFGSGLFARADVGPSRAVTIREFSDRPFERTHDDGVFLQWAMGYAFQAGDIGSVILMASYYSIQSTRYSAKGNSFNVGFLF